MEGCTILYKRPENPQTLVSAEEGGMGLEPIPLPDSPFLGMTISEFILKQTNISSYGTMVHKTLVIKNKEQ